MRRMIPALVLIAAAIFAGAWYYADGLYRASSAPLLSLPSWPPPARPSTAAAPPPAVTASAPADPFAPPPSAALPATPPLPAQPLPPAAGARRPTPLPVPPLPIVPGAGTPSPSGAPPAAALLRLRLTGVVTGTERRAILEGAQTAYVVREGDQVEGWTVTRIDPGGVTLRAASGQEIRVGMDGSAPAPAQAPPRDPRPPAQGTTN